MRVAGIDPPPPVLARRHPAAHQADDDKLGRRSIDCKKRTRRSWSSATTRRSRRCCGAPARRTSRSPLERLPRKFGVDVDTEEVRVPYRETITQGRGRGQVQETDRRPRPVRRRVLRIEPLDRGEGFAFVDNIVGGVIPRQYIPAVQKGIEETMGPVGIYGWPVVDIQVTCFDGKYHPVDSSEMSFKMAGALAFREAMAKAGAVVLEPVSLLKVTVPAEYQGDVMGDLNSRRGRVQGTEAVGGGDR